MTLLPTVIQPTLSLGSHYRRRAEVIATGSDSFAVVAYDAVDHHFHINFFNVDSTGTASSYSELTFGGTSFSSGGKVEAAASDGATLVVVGSQREGAPFIAFGFKVADGSAGGTYTIATDANHVALSGSRTFFMNGTGMRLLPVKGDYVLFTGGGTNPSVGAQPFGIMALYLSVSSAAAVTSSGVFTDPYSFTGNVIHFGSNTWDASPNPSMAFPLDLDADRYCVFSWTLDGYASTLLDLYIPVGSAPTLVASYHPADRCAGANQRVIKTATGLAFGWFNFGSSSVDPTPTRSQEQIFGSLDWDATAGFANYQLLAHSLANYFINEADDVYQSGLLTQRGTQSKYTLMAGGGGRTTSPYGVELALYDLTAPQADCTPTEQAVFDPSLGNGLASTGYREVRCEPLGDKWYAMVFTDSPFPSATTGLVQILQQPAVAVVRLGAPWHTPQQDLSHVTHAQAVRFKG